MLKKYFVTGLIILLPLALTIAIVTFIFNLLTEPFLGFVRSIFDHYDVFETGFLALYASQIQTIFSQVLILICLILFTISLGLIARWFFFKTFLKFTDYIVTHIPLVRTIYKTTQEVIKTIFTAKNKSFKQVVLVRFPHPDTYSVGLVTREIIPGFINTPYEDSVSVFVPTTPNPTSGFLVMYNQKDLIYLDMSIEDAFKYVISCGVIAPPFQSIMKNKVTLPEEVHATL
jgi:uncharacterized membrane protein